MTGGKRNIAPMNIARYNFGLISFRGCLYAVGGWTKDNGTDISTRTMEKYDPIKNKWSLLPSMQQGRGIWAGYAVVGDKICVAGGRDRDCNKLSSVEVFNATTEKWMGGIPEMSKKRSGLSCASLNGELYVLGGDKEWLVSCEKYNFTTKKWTMLSNMEYTKRTPSTFVFESKIFALGYNDVEVYDESKDKWTKCEEMAANMPNRSAYRLAAVACVRTDVLKL